MGEDGAAWDEEAASLAMAEVETMVKSGQLDMAVGLLQKMERVFPGMKGYAEISAVAQVCLAAKTRPVTGHPNLRCQCRPKTTGPKFTDWYHVLQVQENADDITIKKKFRQLALLLHPDKNNSARAEEAFKIVNEAYAVLSDKTKRIAFNMKWSQNGCGYCQFNHKALSTSSGQDFQSRPFSTGLQRERGMDNAGGSMAGTAHDIGPGKGRAEKQDSHSRYGPGAAGNWSGVRVDCSMPSWMGGKQSGRGASKGPPAAMSMDWSEDVEKLRAYRDRAKARVAAMEKEWEERRLRWEKEMAEARQHAKERRDAWEERRRKAKAEELVAGKGSPRAKMPSAEEEVDGNGGGKGRVHRQKIRSHLDRLFGRNAQVELKDLRGENGSGSRGTVPGKGEEGDSKQCPESGTCGMARMHVGAASFKRESNKGNCERVSVKDERSRGREEENEAGGEGQMADKGRGMMAGEETVHVFRPWRGTSTSDRHRTTTKTSAQPTGVPCEVPTTSQKTPPKVTSAAATEASTPRRHAANLLPTEKVGGLDGFGGRGRVFPEGPSLHPSRRCSVGGVMDPLPFSSETAHASSSRRRSIAGGLNQYDFEQFTRNGLSEWESHVTGDGKEMEGSLGTSACEWSACQKQPPEGSRKGSSATAARTVPQVTRTSVTAATAIGRSERTAETAKGVSGTSVLESNTDWVGQGKVVPTKTAPDSRGRDESIKQRNSGVPTAHFRSSAATAESLGSQSFRGYTPSSPKTGRGSRSNWKDEPRQKDREGKLLDPSPRGHVSRTSRRLSVGDVLQGRTSGENIAGESDVSDSRWAATSRRASLGVAYSGGGMHSTKPEGTFKEVKCQTREEERKSDVEEEEFGSQENVRGMENKTTKEPSRDGPRGVRQGVILDIKDTLRQAEEAAVLAQAMINDAGRREGRSGNKHGDGRNERTGREDRKRPIAAVAAGCVPGSVSGVGAAAGDAPQGSEASTGSKGGATIGRSISEKPPGKGDRKKNWVGSLIGGLWGSEIRRKVEREKSASAERQQRSDEMQETLQQLKDEAMEVADMLESLKTRITIRARSVGRRVEGRGFSLADGAPSKSGFGSPSGRPVSAQA
ncbi:hypothetical protein CBR_g4134 [Chara braunii]|uniref:J domain-containing protein n=1 Tax=Chara braunii TaxID=69332 RepID=A0A388KHC2_CHABU|nr:hypothetical protein CBR_g4134 [Chara braunii]|eukprot:GBG69439.1 hypothetical protein CBR_g4134 [Chara braunii]